MGSKSFFLHLGRGKTSPVKYRLGIGTDHPSECPFVRAQPPQCPNLIRKADERWRKGFVVEKGDDCWKVLASERNSNCDRILQPPLIVLKKSEDPVPASLSLVIRCGEMPVG